MKKILTIIIVVLFTISYIVSSISCEMQDTNNERRINTLRPAAKKAGLRPMAAQAKQDFGVALKDKDWVKGIKVTETTPRTDKEISFFGNNLGGFMEVRRAQYQGRTYMAKMTHNDYNQRTYLVPQAIIVNSLNEIGVRGICRPEHFLELDNGIRVVLFEEFPAGETLEDFMKNNPAMTEREAVEIMLKIANALAGIHKAGVCHWEIKCKNIWVTKEGDIIIFDFDYAFISKNDLNARTLLGAGSELYKSRNRLEYKPASYPDNIEYFQRDDIYSLGIILAELLMEDVLEDNLQKYANAFGGEKTLHHFFYDFVQKNLPMRAKSGEYGFSERLRDILYKLLYGGNTSYKNIGELIQDLEVCLAELKADNVEISVAFEQAA